MEEEDMVCIGGCMGNTQGVAALAKGRNIDEVINTIKGITHASANKTDFFNNIIFYIKLNFTRTNSLCFITVHRFSSAM